MIDMPLTRQDIKALRGDLSPFLIHLTRGGNYREWADLHNRPQNNNVTLNAKQSLLDIIQGSEIEARSPFGYFNFKVPFNGANRNSRVNRSWLLSVCFTETPVDHIYVQCEVIQGRQLPFEPYGLAFFEAAVRSRNGNPVLYFDSSNQQIRNSLDTITTLPNCQSFSSMMPLYESFGPALYGRGTTHIDFRWEREWRVRGNFNFNLGQDVAFGICPEDEIAFFEQQVNSAFPFIDPRKPTGLLRLKLRQHPPLAGLI